MTEQLAFAGLITCACGCGRPVEQSQGRGRPARYASPACRVRAHRSPQNPVTKFEVAPDAGAPAAAPPRARADGPTGHFEMCPRCDSPDLYVAGWVLDGSEILGTCPRCGYQPSRRAA